MIVHEDDRVYWNMMEMAEGEGFEPSVPQGGTAVFKTAPFGRSGTPPRTIVHTIPQYLYARLYDRPDRDFLIYREQTKVGAYAPTLLAHI
jgi:hypothetical protein